MNILITGSNGFVGSGLATFLAKDNYIIGTGRKPEPTTKVNEYFQWNLESESIPWEKIPQNIDVIVHAAASLDKNNMNEELINANCLGAHRIFQLAKQRNVKYLFYISSTPVIGIPVEHPITEYHPCNPLTMYHATKLAGEFIFNQLVSDGIEVVSMRVPSPIGPGMPVKTILPIFIQKALNNETITIMGEGTRRQNYLDVRDLGFAIQNALGKKNISSVYNIASDKTVSNLELAKLCVELTESKSAVESSGTPDASDNQVWDVDISKAKKAFGFEPQYTIQQSIKDIAEGMKSRENMMANKCIDRGGGTNIWSGAIC